MLAVGKMPEEELIRHSAELFAELNRGAERGRPHLRRSASPDGRLSKHAKHTESSSSHDVPRGTNSDRRRGNRVGRSQIAVVGAVACALRHRRAIPLLTNIRRLSVLLTRVADVPLQAALLRVGSDVIAVSIEATKSESGATGTTRQSTEEPESKTPCGELRGFLVAYKELLDFAACGTAWPPPTRSAPGQ